MDSAPDAEHPPWELSLTLLFDPDTGRWAYRSELCKPNGVSATLTDRAWTQWKNRWRIARLQLEADLELIETWAGGATGAVPRG